MSGGGESGLVSRMQARGLSMFPAVCPGDVLLVEACRPSDFSPGDLAAFHLNAVPVCHRVIGHESPDTLLAKGDNVLRRVERVAASELLGRVIMIERAGRVFPPPRRAAHLRARLSARVPWILLTLNAAAGLLGRPVFCARLCLGRILSLLPK